MEKAIVTALLIIGSVVATVAIINAVIPAAGKGSSALLTANSDASDRIKTDIDIVFATGSTADDTITFWIKNTGSLKINPIDASDIILTTPTTVTRIPNTGSSSSNPRWDFSIEEGTEWARSVTVKVTMTFTGDSDVAEGVHKISMTVYNGVSAEKEFSI